MKKLADLLSSSNFILSLVTIIRQISFYLNIAFELPFCAWKFAKENEISK